MSVRLLLLAGLILAGLGVAIVLLCLVPLRPRGLLGHMHPVRSYAEGMARLAAMQAQDGSDVNPVCRTRVYTHGAPTERVIVCLHGLTNCPAQFDSLARLAYASGSNVIVPRLPLHGYSDRMTPALARLDPVALCRTTDEVLDAAHGLGGRIVIVGLSLGGTLAGWAAQERDDVDRVVMVCPLFGLPTARGASVFGLTRALATLPNAFVWWNPALRERSPGPPQVYPRFSTRSIAATLLIAARLRADAAVRPPGVHSAVLVTLAHDPAVDNLAAESLLRDWRRHGLVQVHTHEFPDRYGLSHDLIDPKQVGANPELTYPILLEALGQ